MHFDEKDVIFIGRVPIFEPAHACDPKQLGRLQISPRTTTETTILKLPLPWFRRILMVVVTDFRVQSIVVVDAPTHRLLRPAARM